MYGPVPIEVAFFADAGVAWDKGDKPTFFGGDRRGVTSTGVSLRANVLGFAVAQMHLAYPFQRPGRAGCGVSVSRPDSDLGGWGR